MLAGAYPSDEFAELKPRVVWDRVTGVVEGRRDARVVAVTAGGTIPDRGLYGVFMVGEAGTPGRRVGELDEEMVYESRAGSTARSSCSARQRWRVEEIGHDRVTVVARARASPASCRSGTATRSGAQSSSAGRSAPSSASSRAIWRTGHGAARPLDAAAPRATISTSSRQTTCSRISRTSASRPAPCPTDRRIVVERFRDELGDWRLDDPDAVRRPRPRAVDDGARGAAARAARGSRSRRSGRTTGSPIRLPEGTCARRRRGAPVPGPRRDRGPGRRRRSAELDACSPPGSARTPPARCSCPAAARERGRRCGSSASGPPTCSPSRRRYGSFPILVETYRECLADVFDLPALRELLAGVARREVDRPLGRDGDGVTVRELAPVRLRGRVHVRRRRAARGASRAGPDARPRPAARAARPGGAARAARPGRARRPRADAPGA